MNRNSTAALATVLSLVTGSGTLLAGPINPPAGAIGSSMKTLTEVEPRTAVTAVNTPGDAGAVYKITQPGSYYLTGDVAIPAGKNGIVITASNVTLDLNGFSIAGVSSQAQHGVQSSGVRNVVVKNGTVRSMGGVGVYVDGAACRVEKVSAYACNGLGIYLAGTGCAAEGCVVDTSEGTGISVGDAGSIRDCTVVNVLNGFLAGSGSSVSGCVASNNHGGGFGIGCGATVSGCTSKANALDGFGLCSSNMSDCAASNNGGVGIFAGGASTVRGCTVTSNGAEGINAMSFCTLSGNLSRGNTGAGIRLTSGSNRVEGNHLMGNAKGVHAETSGNLVIGNTSAGNTVAFVLAAGTRYGPIVDIHNAAAPAVNGATAASTLATTDPNANIVY